MSVSAGVPDQSASAPLLLVQVLRDSPSYCASLLCPRWSHCILEAAFKSVLLRIPELYRLNLTSKDLIGPRSCVCSFTDDVMCED